VKGDSAVAVFEYGFYHSTNYFYVLYTFRNFRILNYDIRLIQRYQ